MGTIRNIFLKKAKNKYKNRKKVAEYERKQQFRARNTTRR